MGHDASKILLGTTQSSDKSGSNVFASDPATFKAGLAVRETTAGLLSVAKSEGEWLGISLGRSLSDSKKTLVLRSGLRVPILLERQPARGTIVITNYSNLLTTTPDSITVGGTVFTAQSGAVTLGQTTFRAATGNNETAASLAAQINAHATAGALVKATAVAATITLTAISNASAADTIAMAYTDNGGGNIGATVSGATLTDSDDSADWVAIGADVYISDSSGKADDPNSGATVANAIYVSGVMTGIDEDGAEVAVALIDMQGGL